MNTLLQKKIDKLESAEDYECWYLVKQPTDFYKLCYLVSFLEDYQTSQSDESLESFIKTCVSKIKKDKPEIEFSDNYRALRVAAFFGLITMTSGKYEDSKITPTFIEIKKRCTSQYERTKNYKDIIQRQIEKMFISSSIDERWNSVRKDFRLFPVMLLYKVLLELGQVTGNFKVSMTEYRYLVATTTKYESFLDTLTLINLLRQEDKSVIKEFEKYRNKFDNRFNKALDQLETLKITNESIELDDNSIKDVAKKVFEFEQNIRPLKDNEYLKFLGSCNSILSTSINETNQTCASKFKGNRIVFGAPGTGKSYMLEQERKELLGEDNETDYERVTFHPDYSYANFVGTYKPVMTEGQNVDTTDPDVKYVVSVLNDESKTSQEKYDALYDQFKDDNLTRLPLLLGIYTDESFKTKKKNGDVTADNNSAEMNHGRAIRKYIKLITGAEKANDIAYEYVPGPFMRVYVNALRSAKTENPKPYLLIIEEINRANVAAVFGDVFQLLDRGADGASEYSIQASEDIKNYLAKELGGRPDDYSKIRIPDNMFIWATMNSADQGVFPMDTAFKRRWDFTYIGINDNEEDLIGKWVKLGTKNVQKVEWNKLRKAINNALAFYGINEDKQLGPYFISRNIAVPEDGDEIDSEKFIETFKSKVIMYLFEDAAKQKRKEIFKGCFENATRYSEICREFEEKGIGIFDPQIQTETDPKDTKFTPSDKSMSYGSESYTNEV